MKRTRPADKRIAVAIYFDSEAHRDEFRREIGKYGHLSVQEWAAEQQAFIKARANLSNLGKRSKK